MQTEKVWDFTDVYKLPRVIFINKMDRERADFYRVKGTINKVFGSSAISVQLPIGKEEDFQGIIDLIKMKAIVYKKSGEGKPVFEEQEIPQDMKEQAESHRKELVEAVAEFDDEILMKYLDGETLTNQEIASLLKQGVKKRKIVPILCGSATMNLGIELLLDFIGEYLPSPSEMPPVAAKNVKTSSEELVENSIDSPFSAFVFKTVADPYVGNLTYFRVYSGKLPEDSNVYNPSKSVDNKVGKIYKMQGKNQRSIPEICAGDIAAVAKLKNTVTGDTLCDKDNPVLFEKIEYPEPIMLLAISPKTKGDEDKLSTALSKIIDEDPTVKVYRDEDTGETILAGMGESHLEVIIDTMESKFGVEVEKPSELPRMANQPPKIKAPEPITPSYEPDAPLLEQVREAMRKGIDPAGALAMAKSLPDKPERADAAFILLEYAAEAEIGEAALEVGRYFDPTYAGDSGTIFKDPQVAYDWYQLALSQGLLEADIHLSNLKEWVTKQAQDWNTT